METVRKALEKQTDTVGLEVRHLETQEGHGVNRPHTDSWQFLVVGFDAQGEGARSPSRNELKAQLTTALPEDGFALHILRAGWCWDTVSGASDEQERHFPEGVHPIVFGTACMLVLTFAGGAALSGIIGNRADAALVSLMRVIGKQFGRKPPKLTRDTALVQARSAVIACFQGEVEPFMPELLYVMQELRHKDGSWEFELRFHEIVGLGKYKPGPFIYVARVLPSGERTVHTAVRKESAN
jgi:hypothetical protein